MIKWLKDRLIDDCHRVMGLWSVQLHLVVLGFAGLYELSPIFPAPIAAMFPEHLRTGIIGIYAAAGLLARLIKQRSNAQG